MIVRRKPARAEDMHDLQANGTMQSIAALYDRAADRERGKKQAASLSSRA
jgi:hypothetical protein